MAENEMNHHPECEQTDNLVDAVPAAFHDSSVASLPCPFPLNIASTLNLMDPQWSDIFEGDNDVALGIFGIEWEAVSSMQLRAVCSKLNIKDVTNTKKPDMVHCISKTHTNQKAYGAILSHTDSKTTPEEKERNPRKQIHCPFWLMNVVFLDQFVEDFVLLGNVSSRQLLDPKGPAINNISGSSQSRRIRMECCIVWMMSWRTTGTLILHKLCSMIERSFVQCGSLSMLTTRHH